MQENVRPSVRRTAFGPIRDVQFVAHDEAETTIRWIASEDWSVTNNRGLFISHGDNLHRAMGDMYAVTGIPSDQWGILTEVWA